MSSIVAVPDGSNLIDANDATTPIKTLIKQARAHRAQFEGSWRSSIAFASGQHWLVWNNQTRTLRSIQQADPRYRQKELYTADIITEYRTEVLGELGSDDERPELLLQRDDKASEEYQAAANRRLGFGWEFEWDGQGALEKIDRYIVDLGTAAVRCYFDPSLGRPRAEQVPHLNGQPLFGQQAMEALSYGPNPNVTMQTINEGRICWRAYSPFHLLPPPGVTEPEDFPFDCLVVPTPISAVKAQYGPLAADLMPDRDISSTLGQASQGAADPAAYAASSGKQESLRGHVWLFTYFERPTPRNPKGRVFYFAGNDMRLLRVDPQLPYQKTNGDYHSGIVYFHWWKVTGRFWGRSLVEALKDPQRAINKRRTQANEIIDRGLPYIIVQEGSKARKRSGAPLEVVEVPRSEQPPQPVAGMGPGTWMYEEINQLKEDAQNAAGVRGPSLGENPQNVINYSQLALLREADQIKREVVIRSRKDRICELVEFTVYDIRRYDGAQKQIMLAGDDGLIEAETFNATLLPPFYIVRPARGEAKPRSQAAELQKITDLWNAAVATQIVLQHPAEWLRWLKESNEAGQARELPEMPSHTQIDKAELENHKLLQGEQIEPAYYDIAEIHIPYHRDAQLQAEQSGQLGISQLIDQHIQAHLRVAQATAAAMQSAQPALGASPPGTLGPAPPSQGAPGQQEPAQAQGAGNGQAPPG